MLLDGVEELQAIVLLHPSLLKVEAMNSKDVSITFPSDVSIVDFLKSRTIAEPAGRHSLSTCAGVRAPLAILAAEFDSSTPVETIKMYEDVLDSRPEVRRPLYQFPSSCDQYTSVSNFSK